VKPIFRPFLALLLSVSFSAASVSAQGVKTINNPQGGVIFVGALPGQITPQVALGQTLHKLSLYCGDRPVLGNFLQDKNGGVLAAFFTVSAKKQDGKPMAGLALASAPSGGQAIGAVLLDTADRFPTTVNSMFQSLQQAVGGAGSKPASSGAPTPSGAAPSTAAGTSASAPGADALQAPPAQPLQPTRFPDGSGIIGLPAGWQMTSATLGDVIATGPKGEKLRFGLTIPVIDPTNPQSRTLMGISRGGVAPGKFVAIPVSADPATAYKSAITQILRKMNKPPSPITIAKVQQLPIQGGKNDFLYGTLGSDGLVAQVMSTPVQAMGAWQITLFQITAPQQVMADERSTIGAIFSSYSRNSQMVNAAVNTAIQQGIAQTNQFVGAVQQHIDNSDRQTAGMSDFLREKTVLVDTETGGHARTSDDLANAVVQANPNRFQVVPTSDYIKGIDY
jgi:hypothetical protein